MLMVMVLEMQISRSRACDLRVGLSFVDGDCDDTSAQISPAMDEIW